MIGTKQELLERYAKVEKVVDKFGRILVVGRLKPSQELNIVRLADSSDDYVQLISRAAASVRMIDETVLSFPRNAGELNAQIDMLDNEGLTAAIDGLRKLAEANKEAVESDAAKNSPTT